MMLYTRRVRSTLSYTGVNLCNMKKSMLDYLNDFVEGPHFLHSLKISIEVEEDIKTGDIKDTFVIRYKLRASFTKHLFSSHVNIFSTNPGKIRIHYIPLGKLRSRMFKGYKYSQRRP